MPVLLAGPVEFPWYFFVVVALGILGTIAVLLLPITIPLALTRRRDDESAAKLTAKYTLAGVLPAAFLAYAFHETPFVAPLLIGAYAVAWVSAYSSKAHAGR